MKRMAPQVGLEPAQPPRSNRLQGVILWVLSSCASAGVSRSTVVLPTPQYLRLFPSNTPTQHRNRVVNRGCALDDYGIHGISRWSSVGQTTVLLICSMGGEPVEKDKITHLNCVVCGKPVNLRSAVVDARNGPMHEDCYGKVLPLLSANTQRLRKAG